jgi:hypothetical protein
LKKGEKIEKMKMSLKHSNKSGKCWCKCFFIMKIDESENEN